MQTLFTRKLTLITAVCGLAIIAWDSSGLDLPLARLSGGPHGFALQDQWFFIHVLHDGARRLAWALALLLCLGVWRPMGVLRAIPFGRRLQLALTVLLSVSMIGLLKSASNTSCPWSLAEFGGVAHHVSHWASVFTTDGGSGGCFPAGHASAGFAFVAGYFAFRQHAPALARRWLVAALAVGFMLGVAQQMRGAHFMSHTLWTAWLCWCLAWAADAATERIRFGRTSSDFGEAA